jgi:hypothetical protein
MYEVQIHHHEVYVCGIKLPVHVCVHTLVYCNTLVTIAASENKIVIISCRVS